MARDNDSLERLIGDKTISRSNKAKRLSRAIATCETRAAYLTNQIARLRSEKAAVLKRKALAADLLNQLDAILEQAAPQSVEAGPGGSAAAPIFDIDKVRAAFGDIEVFDGAAISLAQIGARRRDADGRVWASPLSAAVVDDDGQAGALSKPADLGSVHAARALERPGYLHALRLVAAQKADPRILDRIEVECAKARVGRLPLADAFVNVTLDGEVAQRLLDPQRRDAELAWMNSALKKDAGKK